MTFLRLFGIVIFFSCCSFTNIGNPKISFAFIEPDSSLLNEIDKPTLFYYNLSGLEYFSSTIDARKKIFFVDNKPTLARLGASYAIIYPGDDISIRIDQNADILFYALNNEKRRNELVFQNVFQNLNRKIKPEFPGRSRNYSIDTILSFEKKLKLALPGYILKAEALFDSLANVYNISDSFKNSSYNVFKNERYIMLYSLYNTYREELTANNLYLQKLKSLLPFYAHIKNEGEIYFGAVNFLSTLADNLMKIKIKEISNNDQIAEAIYDINNNFSHLSRDFLLTKLLNNVATRRIPVSHNNVRKYKKYCVNADYKKIGIKLLDDRNKFNHFSKEKKDNRLIALSNSKIYTLEEVIAKQKGKVILLDLWASWCAPCIEQMPALKKLIQQIPKDKLSVLFLSTDRNKFQWERKSTDIGIDSNSSPPAP